MIHSYTENDFKFFNMSGFVAARALDYVESFIKPGITTDYIENEVYNFLKKKNAYPAPLFYRGFPKSLCTSINEVVCHGIPSKKIVLSEGDIVNIDITSVLNGYHGDVSRTFCIGKVSDVSTKLVKTAYESLMEGIKILKPGITLGDLGFTIQSYAETKGFSVVRDFCGHGVGKSFHEEPNILHYGKKGDGIEILEGMVFTVEPMINEGSYETKVLKDGWTAVTKDKSLSAQFEHTVGITSNGFKIFTL